MKKIIRAKNFRLMDLANAKGGFLVIEDDVILRDQDDEFVIIGDVIPKNP